MKIQRIGNTEICLTFIYFIELKYNSKLSKEELEFLNKNKKLFIDWIYKTAGYYDKSIQIKDTYDLDDYSEKLKKYLSQLLESYKHSDIVYVGFIKIFNDTVLSKYIKPYYKYLNCGLIVDCGFIDSIKIIKSYIIDRKVLLITPFAELIKQQIENNNINILYNNQYKNTIFLYYTYPYKFFNTGKDNDIFETLEIIKNDISNFDFDIALLSCGSDAGILSNFINNLNKDAIYIGGNMPVMFGIFGERDKQNASNKLLYDNENIDDFKPYLITTIPDKYKPLNYKNIENGCYW